MGQKIAIVGAGAVGGYAGAHMVQAGEDVTFIDPWPEHVEHMRKHGLRVTHARDVAEFSVPVRALHVTDAQQLAREAPVDIAFICMKSYDTAWATMLIRQYLAPDGYVVSLQNCMNEETIAGIVGWGKTLGCIASSITRQPARARPHPPRRRQGRGGAHRVSRRRSAWPYHATGGGNLPPGRHRRQRQGDRQSVGRALVETGRQRHGQRALRLHRPDRRRRSCKASRSAASPPGSAAKRSASGRRTAINWRRFCTCRPRRSHARARATRRRCAPATNSASRTASAPPPNSVPRWARTCRRAGAPRSSSSTASWCARAKRSAVHVRANAVLTEIVKRVERNELSPDPRHITELRLN